MKSPELSRRQILAVICIGLLMFTAGVFWQVQDFEFIGFDDGVYVIENLHVQKGLSADSIKWAFTTEAAGFWHPLTWLSLMLDYEIYGVNPGGYHWTNLLLHLATTLLLFLVLEKMTGGIWPSALTAALFAIHPLHVESVAWIAERKDVLSAFFWVLTMGAYAIYTERPAVYRYVIVVVSFVIGLTAKPMLVTLPFVLLLLDYWPLERIRSLSDRILGKLILEKAPLLVVSVIISVITYRAENKIGALSSLDAFSFTSRIANAVISYALYVYRMLWPSDLIVFYPHPGHWPAGSIFASLVMLTSITAAAVFMYSKRPYLIVGWLWFTGTLVPVIGIVQLGAQAMADRYTYIPLTGLFVAVSWTLSEAAFSKKWKSAVTALALLAAAVFSLISWNQTQYWRDTETLFRHAVDVKPGNYLAHNNLGAALARGGRNDEAIIHYGEALRIKPDYMQAAFNMGAALSEQGKNEEALAYYRRVEERFPDLAPLQNNIGIANVKLGRIDEAIGNFERALNIRPDYDKAARNLMLARRDKELKSSRSGLSQPAHRPRQR